MTTKVSNGWTRRNDDSERKYVGVVSGGNGRYRATSVTHNSFITSLGGLDTRTEDTFNFPSMTQQRARATESPSSAESSSKRKRERGHRGGGWAGSASRVVWPAVFRLELLDHVAEGVVVELGPLEFVADDFLDLVGVEGDDVLLEGGEVHVRRELGVGDGRV